MITLENNEISLTVNPRLGGEITRLSFCGEQMLATYDWASPTRSSTGPSYQDGVLNWLSEYRGGWQTLFPNAGDACEVGGVPLPFHGELSRSQVEICEQTIEMIRFRAGARRPLTITRSIALNPNLPRVEIATSIENQGTGPEHFLLCEHPAFDLGPGSRIDLPEGRLISAEADPSEPGEHWPTSHTASLMGVVSAEVTERLYYLPDRPAGWAAVRNGSVGVVMTWDLAALPHLWFWQEIGGKDFPWFGRSRITAIEPASAWPADGLATAIDRGQAHRLAPGDPFRTELKLVGFRDTGNCVVGVDRDGAPLFKS